MFCYHLLYHTDNTTLRTWIKQVSIKQGQSITEEVWSWSTKIVAKKTIFPWFAIYFAALTPFRPCHQGNLFISKKLFGGGPFNLHFIVLRKIFSVLTLPLSLVKQWSILLKLFTQSKSSLSKSTWKLRCKIDKTIIDLLLYTNIHTSV